MLKSTVSMSRTMQPTDGRRARQLVPEVGWYGTVVPRRGGIIPRVQGHRYFGSQGHEVENDELPSSQIPSNQEAYFSRIGGIKGGTRSGVDFHAPPATYSRRGKKRNVKLHTRVTNVDDPYATDFYSAQSEVEGEDTRRGSDDNYRQLPGFSQDAQRFVSEEETYPSSEGETRLHGRPPERKSSPVASAGPSKVREQLDDSGVVTFKEKQPQRGIRLDRSDHRQSSTLTSTPEPDKEVAALRKDLFDLRRQYQIEFNSMTSQTKAIYEQSRQSG